MNRMTIRLITHTSQVWMNNKCNRRNGRCSCATRVRHEKLFLLMHESVSLWCIAPLQWRVILALITTAPTISVRQYFWRDWRTHYYSASAMHALITNDLLLQQRRAHDIIKLKYMPHTIPTLCPYGQIENYNATVPSVNTGVVYLATFCSNLWEFSFKLRHKLKWITDVTAT